MRIGWITANPDFTSHMSEAKEKKQRCSMLYQVSKTPTAAL
jgi:hypothetical protein